MKIAVLSREHNYSTRRLVEVLRERGHAPRLVDALRATLAVVDRTPSILRSGRPFRADAVIPRIGTSVTSQGVALIRHFEQMGVYTLVSSEALAVSRNKLRALQTLAPRVPMPATAFVQRSEDVRAAVDLVGGPPVIVKVLEGTQGVGVLLADGYGAAEAIVETLSMVGQAVLVQRFVAESRGRDLRVVVVADRVVATARRFAREGEFRSNVHRGGRAEAAEPTEAQAEVALSAARVLGLEVAGVDLLESAEGPLVMEVNSSPSIEGIERVTGVDVARAIVEHVERRVDATA